jgi:hypothetical protein
MAEAEHLEESKDKKKEEKQSTLESVIGELGEFAKKAVKIGAVAAVPLAFAPFAPSHVPRAAVTAYGYAAGRATANAMQDKPALEKLIKISTIGTLNSVPIAIGFTALNTLEKALEPLYGGFVAKAAKVAAYGLIQIPTITTLRNAMDYGLGKKFRENLVPSIKHTFKTLIIPGTFNVLYLSQFGLFPQMAAAAVFSYLIQLTESVRVGKGSFKNLYKKINPLPYLSSAASVTGKVARSIFYGVPEAVGAIGNRLGELYKSSPKSAAAPHPA